MDMNTAFIGLSANCPPFIEVSTRSPIANGLRVDSLFLVSGYD